MPDETPSTDKPAPQSAPVLPVFPPPPVPVPAEPPTAALEPAAEPALVVRETVAVEPVTLASQPPPAPAEALEPFVAEALSLVSPPPPAPAAPPPVTTPLATPAAPPPAAAPPAAAPPPAAPPAAAPLSAAPPAAAPPSPPLAPPASSPRPRRGVMIGVGIGVVVLLLLGAAAYVLYGRLFGDPVRNAVAGNCLADLPAVAEGEELEISPGRIVDCTDPAAQFVVEGRLDRLSDDQASSEQVCQSYEAATLIYRGSDYVLCLSRLP
jgi:hypothetical protein